MLTFSSVAGIPTIYLGDGTFNDSGINSRNTAAFYLISKGDINPWADGEIDIRADIGNLGNGILIAVQNRTSTGDGGVMTITAGNGDTQGAGGEVNIQAGAGVGSISGAGGGQVIISSGNSVGSIAGRIYLNAGNGDTGGGLIRIESGGGSLGNAPGGNINMFLGTGNGSGVRGRLNVIGLPTSSVALAAGDIWLNGSVLTIV